MSNKLFENASITISLDTNTPCLEWIAKKHPTSEEFRESELESLRYYQQYKAKYPNLEWFVDARSIEGLFSADTEWVAKEILPKFADAGLTKEAFVLPKDFFGQLTVDDYINETARGRVKIYMFDSIEKAKKWLSDKALV